MNFNIPVNMYTIGFGIVILLVAYGALVHHWPQLKGKVAALLPRIGRELDRQSADLDNFVKNSHATIDEQIAELQAKKKKIADAAAAVKKAAA